jgi:hypothetical protein
MRTETPRFCYTTFADALPGEQFLPRDDSVDDERCGRWWKPLEVFGAEGYLVTLFCEARRVFPVSAIFTVN